MPVLKVWNGTEWDLIRGDLSFTTADASYASSLYFQRGAGDPEGSVIAPVGSIYLRTDGGAGTTLYVKETGSGDTGWDAK